MWESPAAFEYTRIAIDSSGEVVWESSGSLDEASGRSHAVARRGKVLLSPPMIEYGGDRVGTLHYFRHGGREYLVPEHHLEWVEEEAEPFGTDFWWGLRRRLPTDASDP